jgi:hypothetical protein
MIPIFRCCNEGFVSTTCYNLIWWPYLTLIMGGISMGPPYWVIGSNSYGPNKQASKMGMRILLDV